jgi:hypothetical protein
MLDHPSRTQRTLLDRIDATDATLSEPSRGRLQRRQAVAQGCGQIERPSAEPWGLAEIIPCQSRDLLVPRARRALFPERVVVLVNLKARVLQMPNNPLSEQLLGIV